MDCHHGILMHNDDNLGDNHKKDDEEELEKENRKFKDEKPGPCEGLDCLHGVLMHDDKEGGDGHVKDDEKRTKEYLKKKRESTVDSPDFVLHGQKEAHYEEQNLKIAEGMDSNNNLNPEDVLHSHENNVHLDTDSVTENKDIKDTAVDLEDALHGGNKHLHNSKNTESGEEVLKSRKGPPTVHDPDMFLHGSHGRSDTRVRFHRTKPKSVWDLLTGWSLPFISDTVISNVDLLKKRYTPGMGKKEKDVISTSKSKDEDVNTDKEEASGKGDEFDMMHDLGDIGNTAPLNVKHKVHNVVKKKNERQHDES